MPQKPAKAIPSAMRMTPAEVQSVFQELQRAASLTGVLALKAPASEELGRSVSPYELRLSNSSAWAPEVIG